MKQSTRIEAALAISLVLCLILSFLPFERRCGDIRGKVLRLHVLANSDSAEDQELKLGVRDRLLEISAYIFDDCLNIDEAVAAATENLSDLENAAQSYVYSKGFCYKVGIELDESFFVTRSYGNITLPAGIYNALRVNIGSAQGQNWWCVMFPMLCLPGAESNELSEVLSDEELEIVESQGYKLKFYCVELYEKLLNYVKKTSSD